jgi:hypothetical protein
MMLAPFSKTTTLQLNFGQVLEWFEVEVHSMVLDLQGSWLIRTESYY